MTSYNHAGINMGSRSSTALAEKVKGAKSRLVSCFVTKIFYRGETFVRVDEGFRRGFFTNVFQRPVYKMLFEHNYRHLFSECNGCFSLSPQREKFSSAARVCVCC